jgi:hypothetical protein
VCVVKLKIFINDMNCKNAKLELILKSKISGDKSIESDEESRRQNDAITVCQFLCAKLDEGVK